MDESGFMLQPVARRTWARRERLRLAADYVARQFASVPEVERVVLFGSVAARPDVEGRAPNTSGPVSRPPRDLDLAVWVSQTGCMSALQQARVEGLRRLFADHEIGVAHHEVDVFIFSGEAYVGRLCLYGRCPREGKPECLEQGCGRVPLLRQDLRFRLRPDALDPACTVVLYRKPSEAD